MEANFLSCFDSRDLILDLIENNSDFDIFPLELLPSFLEDSITNETISLGRFSIERSLLFATEKALSPIIPEVFGKNNTTGVDIDKLLSFEKLVKKVFREIYLALPETYDSDGQNPIMAVIFSCYCRVSETINSYLRTVRFASPELFHSIPGRNIYDKMFGVYHDTYSVVENYNYANISREQLKEDIYSIDKFTRQPKNKIDYTKIVRRASDSGILPEIGWITERHTQFKEDKRKLRTESVVAGWLPDIIEKGLLTSEEIELYRSETVDPDDFDVAYKDALRLGMKDYRDIGEISGGQVLFEHLSEAREYILGFNVEKALPKSVRILLSS